MTNQSSSAEADRSATAALDEGLVSVVVPVGRVDEPLDEQLRSLSAQDIDEPVEFILALNSPDPAQRLRLDDLLAVVGDPRFRVVAASTVRGPSHARNVGSAAARGTRLAYCDSDDRVHPSWLRLLVAGLADHDAVGGQLTGFGLSERQSASRPPATPGELPRFMDVPYIVSANMAVRREAYEATDRWDERLGPGEDIALSWQLLANGCTLGFVPEAVVDYRYRPGTRAMLKQGYQYGRRLSQVLIYHGVPKGDRFAKPSGMSLLKPNGQRSGRPSVLKTLRRGSLAVGRVGGIVEHKIAVRRGTAP